MMVLHLIGVFAAFNLAFLVLQVAVLRGFRVPCEKVCYGLGPELFALSFAGTRWIIKPLPVISYVVPAGMQDGVLVGYPRATLCTVYAFPFLALLAVVAGLAGIEPAMRWVASAVPQLLSPVHPGLGGGAALLRRLAELQRSQPLNAGLVVSAKLCAFNLLPLPSLAGGRVAMELLPLSPRVKALAATLSMWLSLALMLGWGWAIIQYHR